LGPLCHYFTQPWRTWGTKEKVTATEWKVTRYKNTESTGEAISKAFGTVLQSKKISFTRKGKKKKNMDIVSCGDGSNGCTLQKKGNNKRMMTLGGYKISPQSAVTNNENKGNGATRRR